MALLLAVPFLSWQFYYRIPIGGTSFRVVGLQETGHQDSNCGVRKSATVLRFLTQCLLQGITFSKPGLALKIN